MEVRNELKYLVHPTQHTILSNRLSKVLKVDPHGQEGKYHVRSLYFENDYDHALNENLLGLGHRTKYRMRMYDFDPGYVLLEQKCKWMDKGTKDHLRLTVEEAHQLICGQFDFLKTRSEPLALVFRTDAMRLKLRPKLIIDYQRQAFQFDPGHVRITLDTRIGCSTQVHRFFEEGLETCPQRIGQILLEVKYDAYLPDLVQSCIAPVQTLRSAHSKYVIGRLSAR